MKTPGPADLQRWSEEVARDPGSLAFLPLAEAYRRRGQRDAAIRLCMRGLERHPTNVAGHGLLARLFLEKGDRERAYDEWGIVLRLEAENFEANRGLGFYHLERGSLDRAREHLRRAARSRPEDPMTREALGLVRQREEEAARVAGPPSAGPTATAAAESGPQPPRDPARLFDSLEAEAPFRGALLLDGQGLVLAGAFGSAHQGRSDALGAILGPTIEEASRTADLLRLGAWKGMMLHAADAVVHIAPVEEEHMVVLAADRQAPAGWVLRSAERAAALAADFLGGTGV